MFPDRSSEATLAIEAGFAGLDQERPLGQVACRTGFGVKPASWMIELVKYLGGHVMGTTVFALLGTLIALLIPAGEQTLDLVNSIYLTRQIAEEPTDDAMELVSDEFILDGFGIDDRQALEKEIKEHKQKHSRWTAFKQEFRTWKVALILSEYCSGGVGWGGVEVGSESRSCQ